MSYCSNCGIIIESYDCPVCGWKNFNPVKPNDGGAKGPPQRPIPHSPPRRPSSFLAAGSIGAFLMGTAAIFLAVISMDNSMNESVYEFSSMSAYTVYVLATILFLVGCIIMALGMYGIHREYYSVASLTSAIFLVASPLVLLFFTIQAFDAHTYDSHYPYYHYSYTSLYMGSEIFIGHIFVAAMLILVGTGIRHARYRMGVGGANQAIGALFVFSGLLFMALFGILGFSWVLVSVAGFSAGIIFLLAKPYNPYLSGEQPHLHSPCC